MTPLIAYQARLSPRPDAPAGSANRRQPAPPDPSHADALDRQAFAQMAHWSSGISPISLALAWTDWALHLAHSPGSQARLWRRAVDQGLDWARDTTQAAWEQAGAGMAASCGAAPSTAHPAPLADDVRFASPLWQQWPWRALATANKAWEAWWQDASGLRGMQPHSREQMRFYGRQVLDLCSPGNCLWTNPQALDAAWRSGGQTLVQGLGFAWRDLQPPATPTPTDDGEALAPGRGVAVTPGEVVLRNHLVELIQYRPTTPRVHAEPVLIIPSCIMKYYILDLSPDNSLVRWLVGQGHTVYIVSWRNPDADDALLTLDDYVQEGVLAALAHVHQASRAPVHLMGYCLGGTFAAIAAAALGGADAAGRHDASADAAESPPLASLSLLAAETDFSEPGEMGILIDEAQVRLLEDMMADKGFLTGRQMAASFQFLHARELVWSSRTRRWLLGEEEVPNDLMRWNADVTRLPAVMHSQYLRTCFLNNDLAEGRFVFAGQPIALRDIRCPVFAVGTVKDHVAPWRSVYKIHRLVSAEVTFVLTSGGHNAGIVSEPGHPGRHHQQLTTATDMPWRTPDEWLAAAPVHDGSWWPAWSEWLVAQGSGQRVPARHPPPHARLGPAPGQYVMVRYGD
ncbi:alpha/beta hydrolase [Aquabacterium sp. A08]|uniref:PHA/PHB synthase family protein n=1 Tax=Aquabacterium sp. A08 TaxID=2718532 RepID=UPI00141EDBD8|nr:alpha/beta fold hydrolase [Aquabacterium sp. A08]NIC43457.1 poly-beta-hydroxybutyrate polymerase [Aquabacterium sp. A08]